ncbi:adenylosuccinate lyase [Pelagivirga sediminicola]|uniref:Adenylosuccinate lyase n=1 Tax=Pelagivirga sediminicola TaxID=2170575 RepID=A0A2T7G5V7_9RHOB|nr:adenylosuccinate lyase [Pelagivirga sediminicola]PVA09803.1 adenylosuccinate lyase [Pelagivirga sediminicola]
MKILTLAALLALAPTLSLAMGCDHGKKSTQAMTCAAGTTYDADTKACLPISS